MLLYISTTIVELICFYARSFFYLLYFILSYTTPLVKHYVLYTALLIIVTPFKEIFFGKCFKIFIISRVLLLGVLPVLQWSLFVSVCFSFEIINSPPPFILFYLMDFFNAYNLRFC